MFSWTAGFLSSDSPNNEDFNDNWTSQLKWLVQFVSNYDAYIWNMESIHNGI